MAEDTSSPSSFIFGGDTGVSYEDLKRRRAVAAALAQRSRAFPKTLGEGLTYLGESLGDVIGDRRLQRMEAAQRAKEGGIVKGGPPTSFTPPIGGSKVSSAGDPVSNVMAMRQGGDATSPAAAASAVAPTILPPATSRPVVAHPAAMSAVGDAIGRNEPDETMRSYYTQLASREDPTGGQRVSPTGAAGPFQFTRGTGRQYGLYGEDGSDNRTDVEASVKAVQQLTRDNAS